MVMCLIAWLRRRDRLSGASTGGRQGFIGFVGARMPFGAGLKLETAATGKLAGSLFAPECAPDMSVVHLAEQAAKCRVIRGAAKVTRALTAVHLVQSKGTQSLIVLFGIDDIEDDAIDMTSDECSTCFQVFVKQAAEADFLYSNAHERLSLGALRCPIGEGDFYLDTRSGIL